MAFRTVALAVLPLCAVSLSAVACVAADPAADPAAEANADLERRVSSAPTIYHFGCPLLRACGRDRRVCDAERLRADLDAHRPVAIEYETTRGFLGSQLKYWFVDADGRGSKFVYFDTDVRSDKCGSWCGWHKYDFTTLVFASYPLREAGS
jgi:hypothetical protein